VGPTAGLDRCGKSCPPPGFDPRTVQPVASRYTDYATSLSNTRVNKHESRHHDSTRSEEISVYEVFAVLGCLTALSGSYRLESTA
jgi:hypothetical protein